MLTGNIPPLFPSKSSPATLRLSQEVVLSVFADGSRSLCFDKVRINSTRHFNQFTSLEIMLESPMQLCSNACFPAPTVLYALRPFPCNKPVIKPSDVPGWKCSCEVFFFFFNHVTRRRKSTTCLLLLFQRLRKHAHSRVRTEEILLIHIRPVTSERVQRRSNFGHSLRQQEEIIQLCSCKRSSGGTYQQQRPTLRLGQLEEAAAQGRDGQTWPVHKPEGYSSTLARFSK